MTETMVGRKVRAKGSMTVKDIEDESIPPLYIEKGDVGVITGSGDYENGRAFEIEINGEDIFVYRISGLDWEFILDEKGE